jgi:hypothetical protein
MMFRPEQRLVTIMAGFTQVLPPWFIQQEACKAICHALWVIPVDQDA